MQVWLVSRVPQIQIKSNIGSIWIWSNQIDPDLNLIWFKYLNLNLIWIWIFNSNFQIKSNICQIKSNLARFEFDQIKYSQIWIWIWSNIWFKYLKIKSNCGTLILSWHLFFYTTAQVKENMTTLWLVFKETMQART